MKQVSKSLKTFESIPMNEWFYTHDMGIFKHCLLYLEDKDNSFYAGKYVFVEEDNRKLLLTKKILKSSHIMHISDICLEHIESLNEYEKQYLINMGEVIANIVTCTCDTRILMISGCKCGGK